MTARTLVQGSHLFLKIPESSFKRTPVTRVRCRCKLLFDAGTGKLKAFSLALPLLLFRGYLRKV